MARCGSVRVDENFNINKNILTLNVISVNLIILLIIL